MLLSWGSRVFHSPHFHDKNPQETIDYTVKSQAAAEKLRQSWSRLVFIQRSHLTSVMQGILPGDNFMERMGNPLSTWWKLKILGMHNKPLNAFLAKANAAVRKEFHGQVTYASAPIEAVDWNLFDFVSLDYYRAKQNRDSYGQRLERHFTHGKPIIITEVGLCTYQGAEEKGARGFMIVDAKDQQELNGKYEHDESLQALNLLICCKY